MGGHLNLDGRTPNLDEGTLTLDGGTRPPYNLSTARSKKNITRFQISGCLNSLRPFTPMLPQATLQNSLEFCEIKKKSSSLRRPTVFAQFSWSSPKKKKKVFTW